MITRTPYKRRVYWALITVVSFVCYGASGCSNAQKQPISVAVVSHKYHISNTPSFESIQSPPRVKIVLTPVTLKAQLEAHTRLLEELATKRLGSYWVAPAKIAGSQHFKSLPEYIDPKVEYVPSGYKATSLAYTNAAPDLCLELDVDSVAQVEITILPVIFRDPFQFSGSPNRLKIRLSANWTQFDRKGKKIATYTRITESRDFVEIPDNPLTLDATTLTPLVASGLSQLLADLSNL